MGEGSIDNPGETGVTIKYGKNYEDTWVTFKGTPTQVRQQVIEYFGMKPQDAADLSLAQLVFNAAGTAHAMGALQAGFPTAMAISSKEAGQPASGNDPWHQAQASRPSSPAQPAEEEKSPAERVIAEIEAAPDIPRLKKVWAENQALFADDAVKAAYKAKGRALSQPAA